MEPKKDYTGPIAYTAILAYALVTLISSPSGKEISELEKKAQTTPKINNTIDSKIQPLHASIISYNPKQDSSYKLSRQYSKN